MSYDVLEDRMFKGLKKVISDNTNISAYSEHDTVKSSEYVYISNETYSTTAPNAGSSTFIGQFNIDYITNNRNQRTIRNNKSKLLEVLADNNYFQTSTISYYFDGEVLDVEHGDEDVEYEF